MEGESFGRRPAAPNVGGLAKGRVAAAGDVAEDLRGNGGGGNLKDLVKSKGDLPHCAGREASGVSAGNQEGGGVEALHLVSQHAAARRVGVVGDDKPPPPHGGEELRSLAAGRRAHVQHLLAGTDVQKQGGDHRHSLLARDVALGERGGGVSADGGVGTMTFWTSRKRWNFWRASVLRRALRETLKCHASASGYLRREQAQGGGR